MELTDCLLVEVALLLIGLTQISLTKINFNHPSVIESLLIGCTTSVMCRLTLSPWTEQNTAVTVNLTQCDCLYPCLSLSFLHSWVKSILLTGLSEIYLSMELTDWLLVDEALLLIGLTQTSLTKSGFNNPSMATLPPFGPIDISCFSRFPANESFRRTGLHLPLSAKSSFYLPGPGFLNGLPSGHGTYLRSNGAWERWLNRFIDLLSHSLSH